jgi:hypothetical protein
MSAEPEPLLDPALLPLLHVLGRIARRAAAAERPPLHIVPPGGTPAAESGTPTVLPFPAVHACTAGKGRRGATTDRIGWGARACRTRRAAPC